MKTSFELVAEFRETQGKGASRRLRHDGKGAGNSVWRARDPRTLDARPSEAAASARQRALLFDHPQREGGRSDAGGDPEGRAAAPGASNAIVHVDLQRVEENEKIRISIPLHFKGESISTGRQVAGRHRVAHAHRHWTSPACRRICRNSSRSTSPDCRSTRASICRSSRFPRACSSVELANGRDSSRGVDPQPACEEEPEPTAVAAVAEGAVPAEGAAAAPGSAGAAHRQARRAAPGADAAEEGRRRGEEAKKATPRRNRQRKTPRSKFRSLAVRRGAARPGRPLLFPFSFLTSSLHMAGLPLRAHRRSRQSGARTSRSRVTTRVSGSWMRCAHVTAARFASTASTQAETARITHRATTRSCCSSRTTYMNRSGLAIRSVSDFYKIAAGRDPGGARRARSAGGHGAPEARRRRTAVTTACATPSRTSARTSGACASASAIPATRPKSSTTC